MDDVTLKELLRPYRQDRIAEALGVNSATISSWASGERIPRSRHIKPLANFLKVDIDIVIAAIAQHTKRRALGQNSHPVAS